VSHWQDTQYYIHQKKKYTWR